MSEPNTNPSLAASALPETSSISLSERPRITAARRIRVDRCIIERCDRRVR